MPNIFLHGKGSITAKGSKDHVNTIMDEIIEITDYRKSAGLKIAYEDASGIDCVIEASVSTIDSGSIDFKKLSDDTVQVIFDGVMKVNVSGAAMRDIFEDECTWGITGILGSYCEISDIIEIDTDNIDISKKKPK